MKTSVSKEKFAIYYLRKKRKSSQNRFCLFIWSPGRNFKAKKKCWKSRDTVPFELFFKYCCFCGVRLRAGLGSGMVKKKKILIVFPFALSLLFPSPRVRLDLSSTNVSENIIKYCIREILYYNYTDLKTLTL